MKRVNWSGIICILVAAIVGTADAAGTASEPNFPFRIEGNRFVKKSDSKPVFLNIIGYQPLEPGQGNNGEIRKKRIKDDLRRLRAYQGGTDPIVLRVYPGPTKNDPNRKMPKFFYDGVRELGFWVIRDMYFDPNLHDPNVLKDANDQVNRIITEVNDANAFDVIFAWEIGDELEAPWDGNIPEVKSFIEKMCAYIKQEVNEFNIEGNSNWVTWASWAANDPLFTAGTPIEPNCLDFISYNTYSYDPERMRDHQSGLITGTPYQGYLAALKERYPEKPLVASETGLADNNLPESNSVHPLLHPWYPTYRKGGLSPEQVAEGLADRYWDARLLRNESDANIVIAGLAIFEWNDEWWKFNDGNDAIQENKPEEHFGLGRFEKPEDYNGYQLRYKLQQETVHDLFTLKFRNDPATLKSAIANVNILQSEAGIKIDIDASKAMAGLMRYRWEASRGHIVSDGASAEFYPAENVLGPARITTVSIDGDNYATVTSSKINIKPSEPNSIEILTFGVGADSNNIIARASGRVKNANLDDYKLVCYMRHIYEDSNCEEGWYQYDAQPYQDRYSLTGVGMKSIWIDKEGYWWTEIFNNPANHGELFLWLVDKSWFTWDSFGGCDFFWEPPVELIRARANTVNMDPNIYRDLDNDLLPDYWEELYFNDIDANDRYDDQDKDRANNLEEFLAGTSPTDANDPNGNDTDGDGLWDNWENLYFGDRTLYGANDNPDGDELTNSQEQDPNVGTHPGRTSQDKDREGLPDVWEIRWFGNLGMNDSNNPDGDCLTNLVEYELGTDPTSSIGDFNCDWIVDFYDLDRFRLAWLSDPNDGNWDPNCDIFNPKNNLINFLDYAVLAENWLLEL